MQRNRVTIIDVAEVAGVSKSTVANVLNAQPGVPIQEATRRRVMEAVTKLGYRRNALAAAFSSGRTHTLGVLLPQHHEEATSRVYRQFGQDLFTAVFNAATEANLRVTSIPNWERDSTVEALTDRRVDGLILASLRSRERVTSIYASGIPCVEISSGYGEYLVHPDNEGGAMEAVGHLVGLGHRRIAHYRGPVGDYHASDCRAAGFRAACRRYGLPEAACPVLLARAEVAASLGLPPKQRPTAIFAFNDCQANDVYEIAAEQGLRVPRDLSVVGFDDGIVAELIRPALTTVANSLDAQARRAVDLLQSLWDKDFSRAPEEDRTDDVRRSAPLRIPTRLVVRHSTTNVPKGV